MKQLLLGVALATTAVTASAVPVTFFDTVANGTSQFDSTVVRTGASVATQNLSGLSRGSSFNFADFRITTTDGTRTGIRSASRNNSSGQMIDIDPTSINPELSGITFTFTNAINALGFEVGDWGTCCTPSSLFISFDGGSTQNVGTITDYSTDNPTVAAGGGSGNDTVFVGAIDDTSTFTTVTFYGDGVGEILTAGGTIRYSAVEIGSVNAVPVPAALPLMASALGMFGISRRKKATA